jgi:hypothetical protein
MGGDFSEGTVSGAASASANYVISVQMTSHQGDTMDDSAGSPALACNINMQVMIVGTMERLSDWEYVQMQRMIAQARTPVEDSGGAQWNAFWDAYTKSCYGVANTILGGLSKSKNGLLYKCSPTVRNWAQDPAFETGANDWRVAEVALLAAGGLKYAKFRGPEYGQWKNGGVWQKGWHFHAGRHPSLQQHHLPQQLGPWWKNLKGLHGW